jgi:hypothetical protein
MYPLRAELTHKRVATTNRIGDGLKSSWSAGLVLVTMPTFSGTSVTTAMGIVSILSVISIEKRRRVARNVSCRYYQLIQNADGTNILRFRGSRDAGQQRRAHYKTNCTAAVCCLLSAQFSYKIERFVVLMAEKKAGPFGDIGYTMGDSQ